MKTRRLTPKMSLFRSAFAVANGTLLVALATSVQAQHSKSETSHPSGGTAESHFSQSSQSYASEQKYSSHFNTDTYKGATISRAATQSGNGSFSRLFSVLGRSDTKSIISAGGLYAGLVPGYYGSRGDPFGAIPLPNIPSDPTPAKSEILWHYYAISPFWAYSVDDLYWSPVVSLVGSPEGIILDRILNPVSAKSSDYVTDSPNAVSPTGLSHSAQRPDVTTGRASNLHLPADLQDTLDDFQRAFRNHAPGMLGRHLPYQTSLTFHLPGGSPHFVTVDQFKEGLAKLFEGRRAINIEFEEPVPLGSDRYNVAAWYSYGDSGSTARYVVPIRLILQKQGSHVVLIAFDMD